MLVPLETLSGWPQVPNPTILASLAIFVGFPVLVFIIVVATVKIGAAAHAGSSDDIHANDPLWVGDHESAELEAATANPGVESSDQASSKSTPSRLPGERAAEGDDTGEHVGGAGARW